MWILQGHLYGPYKNCTGQVWYVHWFSSGELRFWSKRLVRTVLGSMLTGICVFSMEILYSYVNSSRSPVRPYKNCTGQVWYVHWFPSGELRFWSKWLVRTVLGSMLTGIGVFSMEILYSYVNSSRSPVRPYKNCTGQVWYVHWFSSGELRFGPNG